MKPWLRASCATTSLASAANASQVLLASGRQRHLDHHTCQTTHRWRQAVSWSTSRLCTCGRLRNAAALLRGFLADEAHPTVHRIVSSDKLHRELFTAQNVASGMKGEGRKWRWCMTACCGEIRLQSFRCGPERQRASTCNKTEKQERGCENDAQGREGLIQSSMDWLHR